MKPRNPIQLATIQVYLFGRAMRRLARAAEREMEQAGVERDPRVPVLDQWAAHDGQSGVGMHN